MAETENNYQATQYRAPNFGIRRVQASNDPASAGASSDGNQQSGGLDVGERGGDRGTFDPGVHHGDAPIDTETLAFRTVNFLGGGFPASVADFNNRAYRERHGLDDDGLIPEGAPSVRNAADPGSVERDNGRGEGFGGGAATEPGGGGAPSCFVAGTMIHMADGSTKPIETIRVGDLVQSFDGLNALESNRVLQLFVHRDRPVFQLRAGDMAVKVTGEHAFLTEDVTWRTIDDIKPGDVLVDADGMPVTVDAKDTVAGLHDTYNFEVENLHTYIAGGFRVHNVKGGKDTVNMAHGGMVEGNDRMQQGYTGSGNGYAPGGPVQGPGGPMADAVPANLSNGEFVIQQAAAQILGPEILQMLNDPAIASQLAAMIRQGTFGQGGASAAQPQAASAPMPAGPGNVNGMPGGALSRIL